MGPLLFFAMAVAMAVATGVWFETYSFGLTLMAYSSTGVSVIILAMLLGRGDGK